KRRKENFCLCLAFSLLLSGQPQAFQSAAAAAKNSALSAGAAAAAPQPAAALQPEAEPAKSFSIEDADTFLTQNKYKQAEEAYRSLLSDDSSGDAYAGLAVSLAKQGSPAKILEAEKILRKAKGNFSDNPNVMAAGGYVSFVHSKSVASPAKRDQYLEASETLCKRAIQANPEILIAQQTLGLVKIAQDDLEESVEPLKKAVSIAENPVNLTLLAQALLRIDPKDKDAEDAVDKALKMDKNYHPAHLQKALILNQQGKPEDAFMELHNIPQAYRSFDWYLTEGDIYRKQGDGPAALASWRESIRLEPHSPESYKHMAEFYAMRGDGELGIASLHDALEILPNDLALRQQLAELALRQDKLDVSESEYRTILASQPDDPSALLGLSRVYFRKARKEGQYPPGWQQLMDQLQNVIAEHGVKGKLMRGGAANLQDSIELSEGEKALAQNRFKEARQHFQTVINNKKDNAYDLLTLGEQAFYDGDLGAAEEAFNFAKQISDAAPRAEQGLSKITSQRSEAARQTKLGDATRTIPEVALDHYKQALIADPQHPNAYYGLFCLYGKVKKPDYDQALNYGNSFLELAGDSDPLRHDVEDTLAKLKSKVDKGRKKK
ncbi:MAG: tetratricopeptide repeat protein, partial [Candidatus Obscuribacterales bacterium]|nr:tetratricopeptide repeat protein [Candidatus Obscuribacterales bacterium]